jgi:hypothetical protein
LVTGWVPFFDEEDWPEPCSEAVAPPDPDAAPWGGAVAELAPPTAGMKELGLWPVAAAPAATATATVAPASTSWAATDGTTARTNRGRPRRRAVGTGCD